MAKLNSSTNEYARVLFDPDNLPNRASLVRVRIYKDADQRAREEAGTMGQYEVTREEYVRVGNDLLIEMAKPSVGTGTLQDDIVTAMYTALGDKLDGFDQDV